MEDRKTIRKQRSDSRFATPSESAFLVDLRTGQARPLGDTTLSSVGLRERADLQRWVSQQPELVAPGLLLITSEFDQWEIRCPTA